MALVLQTSWSELSRKQIEDHLDGVRSRRMVAAIEYNTGQQLKMERQAESVKRRVEQQYDMLQKEILRLDSLIERIEERMVKLNGLQQEFDLLEELREGKI